MALQATPDVDERILASGEEAGTAPDDRRFRPDVEGLRAVAVLLVVLYHAGVPRLTGGYVGVDVFFVISGFVITGLLLRERKGSGRTSILDFYARRCRRIIPAATLVILVTVLFAYAMEGLLAGLSAADDGRWAAVFLANFHFEALGTNYFTAAIPPSPLQNFWSLSVEEQFYVVYPTLFLLVARVRSRLSLRARMAIALGVVIGASYWLSIVQTASHPAEAYFSPFTRAWELALGALVAVGTSLLKRIPAQIAAVLTWAGLGAVLFATFTFNAHTAYPGSLAAVPVIGAAMIIAGGIAVPRTGTESLLGSRPFQWLGRRSYGLYLWHWPILIIAAERVGKDSLPVGESLLLVLLALVVSMVTYTLVENPIRHWRIPSKQSVAAGIALVVGTVAVLSLFIVNESSGSPNPPVVPAANGQVVADQVVSATRITSVPKNLEPSLTEAASDWGSNYESQQCYANFSQFKERVCTLGDPKSSHLMVVYGDSQAIMWLQAFNAIAKAAHWRLVMLVKLACPAPVLTAPEPPGFGRPGAAWVSCSLWHQWAVRMINRLRPNMLIVSSESNGYPAVTWRNGLLKLYDETDELGIHRVLLGGIPVLPQSGPECLSAHPRDVQACSSPTRSSQVPLNSVERSVAAELKIQYINLTAWFCSQVCTAIVGKYNVYINQFHITSTYARYLEIVLGRSLGFPSTP
jgi:peptidoglycan/LPS O-acetylase OafA/YrhL